MKASTVARNVIERLVSRFGYKLVIDGVPPRGFENFLALMKQRGLRPGTVFDVGVGRGTPWLYEAFPEAHFVLIEPQSEFKPYLDDLCKQYDAEYHIVGVGSTEGSMFLYRLPGSPTGSSFLPPTEQAEAIWGEFDKASAATPIVKLDRYGDRPAPFLLKIDTEGFELEVLRGASGILDKTEVVIMEVGIVERQAGESDLFEIGNFMKQRGFRLVDIPVLTQQSIDGPLLYIDVAFVKAGTADPAGR